jgi:hypothetical protein
MMPIRFSPSSLKEGRWYEYAVRFALGGTATVFTVSSAAALERPSVVSFSLFPPSSVPAPH